MGRSYSCIDIDRPRTGWDTFSIGTDDTARHNMRPQTLHYSSKWNTHTRLMALCPGLPRWAGSRKVNQSRFYWNEIVSGSGIRWAIYKSAPRYRQITTPFSFLQAGCPSCCLTNIVKALQASDWSETINRQWKLHLLNAHIQKQSMGRFTNDSIQDKLATYLGINLKTASMNSALGLFIVAIHRTNDWNKVWPLIRTKPQALQEILEAFNELVWLQSPNS